MITPKSSLLTHINVDTLVGIANWSSPEFALAVVSASLATLRPLVIKLAPSSKRQNAVKILSQRVVIIGGSDKHSGSHKEGTRRQQMEDEFQRISDNDTEIFAFHQVPEDLEWGGRRPDASTGLVITNLFRKTRKTGSGKMLL